MAHQREKGKVSFFKENFLGRRSESERPEALRKTTGCLGNFRKDGEKKVKGKKKTVLAPPKIVIKPKPIDIML